MSSSENPDQEVQIHTDIREIATFVDDGTTSTVETMTKPVPLNPTELKDTIQESYTHDIKSFLARPILLDNVTMDTTMTPLTELASIDFPERLIQDPMYQEKLTGFVGFRGVIQVKVVVNAQPFQAALLRLVWIPNAQNMPRKVRYLTSNLTSMTSLPGIDLRVPMQASTQLELPFISPQTAVNLVTGEGRYGTLKLFVYSPLVVSPMGTNSVNIQIFANMKDPLVEFPTSEPIFPGFLTPLQQMSRRLNDSNVDPESLESINKVIARFEAGTSISQTEEASFKSQGIVTQTLLAASGVAGVAALFPTLTPFAAPVALATAGLAGVAALFGWSKPTNLGSTQITKLQAAKGMTNVNGEDTGHKMALCVGNAIDTQPSVMGTVADEMSFAHVVATPAYVDSNTWSTTEVAGTRLMYRNVSPVAQLKSQGARLPPLGDPYRRFDFTPMAFVANRFTYWRGDIVFTLKVVKTQFHSGRIRLLYIPGRYTFFQGSLASQARAYSEILDLKERDSIQFTLPYVSTAPWLNINFSNLEGTIGSENSVGSFYIVVLTQLRAPETVSQTVNIILEVSGAPSLQFAVPTFPKYIPYDVPDPAGEEFVVDKPVKKIASFQAGNTLSLVPLTRAELQSGMVPPSFSTSTATDATSFNSQRATIGETILSVRSMLKRFSKIYFTAAGGQFNSFQIFPYEQQYPIGTETENPIYDDYSYWASVYAFGRGSMRIKADLGGTGMVHTYLMSDPADPFWIGFAGTSVNGQPVVPVAPGIMNGRSGYITQVISMDLEGLAELEVPPYMRFHNFPLEFSPFNAITVRKGNVPSSMLYLESDRQLENLDGFQVYRAVGDDFSFGFFLGAPEMIFKGSLE